MHAILLPYGEKEQSAPNRNGLDVLRNDLFRLQKRTAFRYDPFGHLHRVYLCEEQRKSKVQVNNKEDANVFLKAIGYKDLIRIVDHIDVYEKDGKNYVSYAIGSNKFEKEVTSNDVKVYVKSSARVNADDTNGVNVKLTNSTTLPVYFKVVDDDASNPRFVLGETSGGVKVY